MTVAISLPMRVDAYGRTVLSSSMERIWADRVRCVIATTVGERAMRPDFGSRIPMGLMDAIPELPEMIQDAVASAFARHLQPLQLLSVDFVYSDEGNGEIDMRVNYAIPFLEKQYSLDLPYQTGTSNV